MQLLVVGPHVHQDRQTSSWMYPSTGRVQIQLADRDSHPIRSQISQAQNPLAVCDDSDVNLALRPVVEDAVDVALVLDREVHAAGALEDVAIPHAGQSHHRRVDDGHQLLQVVDYDTVEESLVGVKQRHEEEVLVQGLADVVELFHNSLLLQPQRLHSWRQQPSQMKPIPLVRAEGVPMVHDGVSKTIIAKLRTLHPPPGGKKKSASSSLLPFLQVAVLKEISDAQKKHAIIAETHTSPHPFLTISSFSVAASLSFLPSSALLPLLPSPDSHEDVAILERCA
eukprot:766873-Hanusia_phi.AAC.3